MAHPVFRSITLITSPYHVGVPNIAVARGVTYLSERGILDSIKSLGLSVEETGLASVEKDFEGDISRSFELFRRTSEAVRKAHAKQSFPIVLAGNCSSSVGVAAGLSEANRKLGKDLACVWFDAHDDFNTPDTMSSGYFDSMPIAMLGGLTFKAMVNSVPGFTPLDLKRLVHVGMRDVNDMERQHVEEAKLSVVWGDAEKRVDFEGGLAGYLEEKNLRDQPTYVHFDVDALDTSIGIANQFAAPGGLHEEDIKACLRKIASTTAPMALTVASFDPGFDGADAIAEVAIKAIVAFLQQLRESGRFGST
ncbi:hypothetical protein jhhlp_000704 [Lomentospora prolificans]|uniref:Arginase n=1 Tax=Lomentospora prolificans TaxID=41688 RepID=A0A2N3NJ73_9PEZI|nr:hypothetical protein jhhlp_000704 [Lomentospora prolificans]